MKNRLLTGGFLLALALTARATTYSYSAAVNAVIPDGNLAGISATTTLSGLDTNPILNVAVRLNISGGYNGDLYGYLLLRSDDGSTTKSILLNRVGRTGASGFGSAASGFTNITLTGAGGFSNIHDVPPASGGTYLADGRTVHPGGDFSGATATAGLEVLNGRNANGTWTLVLADVAGDDTSTLVNWGLDITVATNDLVIDSFQYATTNAAQAEWVPLYAGQPVVPTVIEGVSGLNFPYVFTTNTVRAAWDKVVSLDLSAYTHIKFRLNGGAAAEVSGITIHFLTGSGGWWHYNATLSDQWRTVAMPLADFKAEGIATNWTDIRRIRISAWQAGPGTGSFAVTDLRAIVSSSVNMLLNSGFEVTRTENLPDYWGSGHWSLYYEPWVTNTAAWRARWGVDRTVSHSGSNSLRVVSAGDFTQIQVLSQWFNVIAGQAYTLSAWLKSDSSSLPVQMKMSATSANQAVTVDGTWRRYSVSGVAPASGYQALCQIYPTNSGTLWVDDVQLEPGATASSFQPSLMDENISSPIVHRTPPAVGDYPYIPGGSNVTVSIDAARRFLVDGQPFVPIALGWSAMPAPAILQEIARAGFNTLCLKTTPTDTTADLRTTLDNARTSGLKVIFWAHRDVTTNVLAEWVANLKDHAAIIAWYVYDEPDTDAEWQDAADKYAIAKTNDPGRPAFINTLPFQAHTNAWVGDIMSLDIYPVPVSPPGVVASETDRLEQWGVPAGNPSWIWLQNIGYAFYLGREPTGPEAEGMAYLSMIHGARGFMYFIWKSRSEEHWAELRALTRELRQLTPVMYSTNPSPAVTVTADSIHLLGKTYDNQDYLVAVNSLSGTINATLTVAGTAATRATVLFEDRSVNVVGGQIVDTFAGYQRHVYALMPAVANELMIDSFQYATAAAAQSNWIPTTAGQPVLPATNAGVFGLSLPNIFTTNTTRGYWDRIMNLDLSAYSGIAVRLKSTRPSVSISLHFQTTAGGWYGRTFTITDQWVTYRLPFDSFAISGGTVSGWSNITGVRISCWQGTDATPATVYVSDLRASTSENLLPNSGFEVTTAEAMPDYWGPVISWGAATEGWVLDMAAWRACWGVDWTVNHTPNGSNSLRIIKASSSPAATDLRAVANWAHLSGNTTNTLSVWLRSDQPNLPVTLRVDGCIPSALTTVTTPATTNSWQRYSLNIYPTNSSDTVSCSVYPTTNGTLWVDDVQLEENPATTEWQPSVTDANMELQTVHKAVPAIGDAVVTPGGGSGTAGIDGAGRFLVDGRPFIPMALGWTGGLPSSNVVQHLAQAGFNAIAARWEASYTTNDIRTFLNNAQTNGLKVIVWVSDLVPTNTLGSWITALKDHPAIIIWYVYDEPLNSTEWLEATNKYILAKTLDPSRPAMINVTHRSEDISHDWASDVLSMDDYPVGFGRIGWSSRSISEFGDNVETLHQVAVTVGKPTWSWLQSMGYAYFAYREPTGAEAEGMAYLALIHGSRGITYFEHKPRTLEQWDELRVLTRELRLLTPVLYSTNPPPAVTVTPDSVHLVGKTYNNQKYIVAVNSLSGATNATLTVADTNATRAAVLFENRSVNVVAGQIVDTFAGYQRHVYCLVPPATAVKKTPSFAVNFTPGGGGQPQMTLTWPGDYLGWIAQVNEQNLAATNLWFDIAWSDLGWSATATQLSVPINPALPKAFYRLRLP